MTTKPQPQPGSTSAETLAELQARINLLSEALRDSEERFRAVVQQSGVGIVQVQPDGCVAMCNPVFARMLGYESSQALVGTSIRDLTPLADLALEEPMIAQVLAGHRDHYNIRKRMYRRDRSTIWVQVNSSVVRDALGQLAGAVGVIQDVSEEVASEATLRESEERFRTMADGLPMIVWVHTADGRLAFVNHTYCEFFGVTAAYATGSNWIPLMHPEDAKAYADEFMACVRSRRVFRAQVRVRRADGQWRWIDSYGRPRFAADGTFLGFVGASPDITEAKLAEQAQRELNQTLERRVAERTAQACLQAEQLRVLAGELTQAEQRERERLAQVLHDELQQIMVAARMQLAGLPRAQGPQALGEEVRQLDELLVQVMQCSRNLTVDLAPVALQESTFLGALEWLASHMQQRYGLTINVDGMESVEPDNPHLRTLVFNAARELLFNVVKHAKAQNADMRLDYDDQDRLRMTVQDDGQGFDPQLLPDRHDGGGFGLFSVKERLSLFGGELHVESQPGQGTRAVLIAPALPINEPAESSVPQGTDDADGAGKPEAGATEGRCLRVLLADDHQVVRDGLSSLIESQPDLAVVGQASDGEQAVSQARELQPDVVVLDVNMPRLNGIDVARILRKDLPQVHIIGLSMHDDPHISASMRSAGAAVFLTKDCPSHLLLAAIRERVTA